MFAYMPITATLAIIAAGSMAGVPLLNGFLSKEMFFAETVSYPQFEALAWVLPLFATLAGMLAVALFVTLRSRRLLQRRTGQPATPAARTPTLDARTDRTAGAVLSAGRHVSRLDGRPLAGCRGSGGPADQAAPVRAGVVARLQQALADERTLALAGGVLIYALRVPLFAWQAELPPMHPRIAFERFYRQLATGGAPHAGGARQRLAAALQRAVPRFIVAAWRLGLLFGAPAASLRIPEPSADEVSFAALLALLLGHARRHPAAPAAAAGGDPGEHRRAWSWP
jgi:multicomponent K+:H+ antiporter subunit A